MDCWLIENILGPVQGHRRDQSEAASSANKGMFRVAHQAASCAASQAVCAAQVGGGTMISASNPGNIGTNILRNN